MGLALGSVAVTANLAPDVALADGASSSQQVALCEKDALGSLRSWGFGQKGSTVSSEVAAVAMPRVCNGLVARSITFQERLGTHLPPPPLAPNTGVKAISKVNRGGTFTGTQNAFHTLQSGEYARGIFTVKATPNDGSKPVEKQIRTRFIRIH